MQIRTNSTTLAPISVTESPKACSLLTIDSGLKSVIIVTISFKFVSNLFAIMAQNVSDDEVYARIDTAIQNRVFILHLSLLSLFTVQDGVGSSRAQWI